MKLAQEVHRGVVAKVMELPGTERPPGMDVGYCISDVLRCAGSAGMG